MYIYMYRHSKHAYTYIYLQTCIHITNTHIHKKHTHTHYTCIHTYSYIYIYLHTLHILLSGRTVTSQHWKGSTGGQRTEPLCRLPPPASFCPYRTAAWIKVQQWVRSSLWVTGSRGMGRQALQTPSACTPSTSLLKCTLGKCPVNPS